MKKKRVIMARIGRLDEADDSFDLEFWHRVGPAGTFRAMCEMVGDYYKLNGRHGHVPRLSRSVAVLKRR